jgi:hypothetical protein
MLTTGEETTTAPIERASARRPGARPALRKVRHSAAGLHLALACAVVLGVFVQVYLIGSYIFGAGQGALDAHETAGFVVQGLEVIVFLAALPAWLPRVDLALSLALAVIGSLQAGLAGADRWVGGLHPLLALVVLGLAAGLALRGIRRRCHARFLRSS